MRDILILMIVVPGLFVSLRKPWIGIMLWTWLSLMNPHRYTFGLAYSAPLAAMTVGTVAIGFLVTKERESPFKGSAVTIFLLLMLWMTASWLLGIDVEKDYEQWKKVMKIDFMILVALSLLHSKKHIFSLAWVVTSSLAILGIKGGIFTITTGGNYRVWGPPGSFIEDNNEFALALVMTIPLLRFLQMQVSSKWGKHGLTAAMVLCAASALGSQSRGALLAIVAMSILLWWNGKNKVLSGFALLITAPLLITMMPESWFDRMGTISTYDSDASAMGRISAWWNAWNLAWHYPFGVGFDPARPELFAIYSPYPNLIQAAHSIYFQMMGNHGFIGLGLFLALWIATWRSAAYLRRESKKTDVARWCGELGAMCQVSLIGYAVGGAFLSLSYFDLPYNIMVMVVLTHVWLQKRGWESEPVYTPGWLPIPGLSSTKKQIESC